MLINIKGQVDPSHFDIILASGLMDKNCNFYNLTFKQALDEILLGEELESCTYKIDMRKTNEETTLEQFIGWTKTKVLFLNEGLFVQDRLLGHVPRNPST